MTSLYTLKLWRGMDCDITLGKVYTHTGVSFKDDAGDRRGVSLGNWEVYVKATEVQGVQPSHTFLDKKTPELSLVRDKNLGNSDYSSHNIQPWDIWLEYQLNPWDADIQKRLLRTKKDAGMTPAEQRILDYKKIIHNCEERIRQLES